MHKSWHDYKIKGMKFINKRTILIIVLFFAGFAYGSEEVYLDLNTPDIHRFDTGKLQYENKKLNDEDDEDYLNPSFYTMKKMLDEDFRSKDRSFGSKIINNM